MARKRTLLLVAAILATTLAGPLYAAADALTLVPDKALAIVVVNRLGETSGKLGKLSQLVKAPLPGPLALLKRTIGIEEGLDESGSTILAVLAPDGAISSAKPVAIVPVSDYAKFVAQFGGDGSEAITEVTMGDQQILAARQGGYAMLVDADSREMLERLRKVRGPISSAINPLETWITQSDVAVAVLPDGIKLGLDTAIEGLDMIKQVVATQQPSGPQAEQINLAFDMYGQLFRFCRAEVDVAAIGIHIDDDGNTRIGGRLRFVSDGRMAKLPSGNGLSPTKLFCGLPDDDFVFAGGAVWSPEWTEKMMKWSLGLMKSNSKMYGLEKISDEQMAKLLAASMQSMKGIKGMGFRMTPGSVSDPIYSNILFTMRLPDSGEFLVNYRKYISDWNEMTAGAEGGLAMTFDVTDTTIAGQKALQVSMDMRQIVEAQIKGNPDAAKVLEPMFEKLFGADGKMRFAIVQIDPTTVASGIGTDAQIERAVEQMRSGEAGMDVATSIGKTAPLLPETASLACFVSPSGVIAWVDRLVQTLAPAGVAPKIPPMSETAAIGFVARLGTNQLETETVVPAEALEAIGGYVEQLRQ